MEYIKQFIIALVTTIIFITAVEIITPDKPIKKYIKFVLNLILVSVLLNPIVYLFTKGEAEIVGAIKGYEDRFYSDMNIDKKENISEEKRKVFKENLNKNCDNLLNQEFSDKNFKTNVQCILDLENMTYIIESIQVGVKDNSVKLIDKININTNLSKEVISTEEKIDNEDEILNFLSEQLKINREKIEIYKMEGSE